MQRAETMTGIRGKVEGIDLIEDALHRIDGAIRQIDSVGTDLILVGCDHREVEAYIAATKQAIIDRIASLPPQ